MMALIAKINGEAILCDTCLESIQTNQKVWLYDNHPGTLVYCSKSCAFEGYRLWEMIDPDDPDCSVHDFDDVKYEFKDGIARELLELDSNIVPNSWKDLVWKQNVKMKEERKGCLENGTKS